MLPEPETIPAMDSEPAGELEQRLRGLLIADPVETVAAHIATQCERLAESTFIATTGERALAMVREKKPEMVILSLELQRPETLEVARGIRDSSPGTFVVISFRELAVPTMERLGKLEVGDFMPQPLDFAALFRATSRRFERYFRRHDRHSVTLDVLRADGVLIGRTRNLSEGGMLFDAFHPLTADESLLVDLGLHDRPLRVRCQVLGVDGQAPAPVKARVQFENLRGPEQRRLIDFLGGLGRMAVAR
jgi:CheY-like chemotaxis protein